MPGLRIEEHMVIPIFQEHQPLHLQPGCPNAILKSLERQSLALARGRSRSTHAPRHSP